MNSLTIFDIPFVVTAIMPLFGAGSLAWAGYLLGQRINLDIRFGSKNRLDSFLGTKNNTKVVPVAIGSENHRVRVAFQSSNIDAAGSADYYIMLGTIVVGAVMTTALMVLGLPFITSLVGFVAARVFINGWVSRAWTKVRLDMEGELPKLLMRLASMLQTTPNVPSALEAVSETLKATGPLRVWAQETAARMHSEGYGVMEPIRQNAAGISTSLSIATELIGRVWTTGGEGYSKAFLHAADNLESVLDARVEARAKGSGAQGTVNILTAMTFGMIGFMLNSEALAASAESLLVQVLYAVIALVIVYGHSQVSDLIDNLV